MRDQRGLRRLSFGRIGGGVPPHPEIPGDGPLTTPPVEALQPVLFHQDPAGGFLISQVPQDRRKLPAGPVRTSRFPLARSTALQPAFGICRAIIAFRRCPGATVDRHAAPPLRPAIARRAETCRPWIDSTIARRIDHESVPAGPRAGTVDRPDFATCCRRCGTARRAISRFVDALGPAECMCSPESPRLPLTRKP